ncbi:MAG TPA: ABC transporter substrate-binding protein [Polyangiaceae bacterium]|nr:ABC transporter substrate-binding protein [Polyangiaceae bacterium]
MRIVSLLPSATEMVYALGAGHQIVGISHECDFPEAARRHQVLTRARISTSESSAAIDGAVRGVIGEALSLYAVDEARLAALAPDLIVTQDLCQVCAVSLDDVRSAVARLSSHDSVNIVSLSPTRLAHVFDDVETVARALGRVAEGQRLRGALEARVRAIAERAQAATTRPRVVSIEWLAPIMLGGTWMPELIALAGGIAAGARAGEPAPTLSVEALSNLDADVVLVKPCGFDIARTLRERSLIEQSLLPAFGPNTRVVVSDGNAFFNRPGPRLVESLEILAACVHPQLFPDFAEKHARELFALTSA